MRRYTYIYIPARGVVQCTHSPGQVHSHPVMHHETMPRTAPHNTSDSNWIIRWTCSLHSFWSDIVFPSTSLVGATVLRTLNFQNVNEHSQNILVVGLACLETIHTPTCGYYSCIIPFFCVRKAAYFRGAVLMGLVLNGQAILPQIQCSMCP